MKLLLVFLFSFSFINIFVNCARILGVFHVPNPSHYAIGGTLLKGLADKGHDVTIASPYPSKDATKNYRDIYLEGLVNISQASRTQWLHMSSANLLTMLWKLSDFQNHLTETTLKSPEMIKLLKSGEKFDVIFFEAFGNEAFFGLAHHFNSHVVILSTASSMFINPLAGNVAPYSFVPFGMTTFSDRMTFKQRIQNIFSYLFFNIYNNFWIYSHQKKLYESLFKDVPTFDDSIKNASLYLINSNTIFETPRPYLPNMIQINGIHIKKPKKLEKDLQDYLDNAKEGVILFSLGSNLQSKDLDPNKRKSILKSFAKFSQKVLWKFEEENMSGIPVNVRIEKWLPQSDLLAHPNVKLFITHGGLLSFTEAVYRAVPLIGIPFYGSQHANTAKFVSAGYGEQILFEEITEDTFTEVIQKVLNNTRYYENIKRSSNILNDKEKLPLDRAIYWIEFIIKHKGGSHLKSASLDLNIWQYLLIDVISFIILIFLIILIIIFFIIKTLICIIKNVSKKKNLRNKLKKK